jgi:hypothetical protein
MSSKDPISWDSPLSHDDDPNRPLPLDWQAYNDQVMAEWYALLTRKPEENVVQDFLERHPAMVPGGSGDVGPGGHHGSDMGAMFKQPTLQGAGRTFIPDFMWVTRSSSLITPILVEIEKPDKRWFTSTGRPTAQFTEAHDQLAQWRDWFRQDGNTAIFRQRFQLLGDRYPERQLTPQFVLVYGRQSEFERGGGHSDADALNRKRDSIRQPDEKFYTFDSLRPRFDHSQSITVTMTAQGPEPFAFSPVFGTGPSISDGTLLFEDISEAVDRSVMMTEDRRGYLRQRWSHWQESQRTKLANPSRVFIRTLGRE